MPDKSDKKEVPKAVAVPPPPKPPESRVVKNHKIISEKGDNVKK